MTDVVDQNQTQAVPQDQTNPPAIPAVDPPRLPPSMQNVAPAESPVESQPGPIADTGNALIDLAVESVLAITKASDEDLTRALGKALEYGDLSLVDGAFLAEKFPGQEAKVLAIGKAILADKEASSAKLLGAVHAAAGGEANWQTAVTIFNANADAATKEVVKTLFNSGSDAAIKAAAQQVLALASAQGVVLSKPETFRPNGAPAPTGLSADGFQTELAALNKEFKNRVGTRQYNEKYDALVARRSAGRRAGL